MTTIAERVAAGAAWLDEHHPGWDQRIDLDRLNLESSCDCILGQLHDNPQPKQWDEILADADLDVDNDEDIRLGFGMNAFPVPLWIAEARALTAAWRELIQARRQAGDRP